MKGGKRYKLILKPITGSYLTETVETEYESLCLLDAAQWGQEDHDEYEVTSIWEVEEFDGYTEAAVVEATVRNIRPNLGGGFASPSLLFWDDMEILSEGRYERAVRQPHTKKMIEEALGITGLQLDAGNKHRFTWNKE